MTDITYIRTQEGEQYLAVDALLMAVWQRKPKPPGLGRSDLCGQFTGGEWQDFLKADNLSYSMTWRGNCHDNAIAESFFQLLKRVRIKRRIYPTRDKPTTYLIIPKCFTTQSVAMVPMMICRR